VVNDQGANDVHMLRAPNGRDHKRAAPFFMQHMRAKRTNAEFQQMAIQQTQSAMKPGRSRQTFPDFSRNG